MRSETSITGGGPNPVEAAAQALEKLMDRGERLLLALDRDGTLIPIADRPEEARPDAEISSLLQQLCCQPRLSVAIVSARSKAQLKADFPGLNLIYAGNYGMEIDFPDNRRIIQEPATDAVAALKSVRDELAVLTKGGINAILEDHGFSLCLHWHSVNADKRKAVHDTVLGLIKDNPDLLFKSLSTSYEVLPRFEWDKGKALQQIVEVMNDKCATFCYFGDSSADEPAFAWVNARGGVSVKVGSAGSSTNSKFQLPDTAAVRATLTRLIQNAPTP